MVENSSEREEIKKERGRQWMEGLWGMEENERMGSGGWKKGSNWNGKEKQRKKERHTALKDHLFLRISLNIPLLLRGHGSHLAGSTSVSRRTDTWPP